MGCINHFTKGLTITLQTLVGYIRGILC